MAAVIVVLAGVVLWLDIAAIRSHLRHTASPSGRGVDPAPRSSRLDHLFDQTFRRLVALFDLRTCWFEPFPFDSVLPRIERGRIVAPAEEPGSPPISYTSIELPVRMDGLTLGRIVLLPTAQSVHDLASPSARETAIAMAEDLAAPVAAALRTGDLSRSAR
jgi:hypothetical protein